jgi:hypothetical protein
LHCSNGAATAQAAANLNSMLKHARATGSLTRNEIPIIMMIRTAALGPARGTGKQLAMSRSTAAAAGGILTGTVRVCMESHPEKAVTCGLWIGPGWTRMLLSSSAAAFKFDSD